MATMKMGLPSYLGGRMGSSTGHDISQFGVGGGPNSGPMRRMQSGLGGGGPDYTSLLQKFRGAGLSGGNFQSAGLSTEAVQPEGGYAAYKAKIDADRAAKAAREHARKMELSKLANERAMIDKLKNLGIGYGGAHSGQGGHDGSGAGITARDTQPGGNFGQGSWTSDDLSYADTMAGLDSIMTDGGMIGRGLSSLADDIGGFFGGGDTYGTTADIGIGAGSFGFGGMDFGGADFGGGGGFGGDGGGFGGGGGGGFGGGGGGGFGGADAPGGDR